MMRLIVLAALVIVGGASLAWSQGQQTPPPATPNPAYFTGKVTPQQTSGVSTVRLTFDPSARTAWHSHSGGQVIIVEQGKLRVQERGKPGREFNEHEVYSTGGGVMHWHGATPDGPMTTVAVSFGTATWGDKISDADYAAAKPK
jgi:quercetin dioxygenase-like cupin family protein